MSFSSVFAPLSIWGGKLVIVHKGMKAVLATVPDMPDKRAMVEIPHNARRKICLSKPLFERGIIAQQFASLARRPFGPEGIRQAVPATDRPPIARPESELKQTIPSASAWLSNPSRPIE